VNNNYTYIQNYAFLLFCYYTCSAKKFLAVTLILILTLILQINKQMRIYVCVYIYIYKSLFNKCIFYMYVYLITVY